MNKILIVEDDSTLANGLCRALSDGSSAAQAVSTLAAARDVLQRGECALVLLDVNLPDGNGFDFLTEIRGTVPIIILTANDLESDIVTGLENGAEDYITKPFSLAVLRARVKAQLRRKERSSKVFVQGKFRFDFDCMEYSVHGKMAELSKTEQRLLRVLVENRGHTLERGTLLEKVWQDGFVDENALSVTVKRLRDKLDAKDSISTVYGIGYRWVNKHE